MGVCPKLCLRSFILLFSEPGLRIFLLPFQYFLSEKKENQEDNFKNIITNIN